MDSIAGVFFLAAFVGGLFCRRVRAAVIVGATVALLYALLVLIGLWNLLAEANLPYLLGALTGASAVIFVAALLAFSLRRGVAWLIGRLSSRSP